MPSKEEIESKRTIRGGWTKKQLAEWGVSWSPKSGWKRKLQQEWETIKLEEKKKLFFQ